MALVVAKVATEEAEHWRATADQYAQEVGRLRHCPEAGRGWAMNVGRTRKARKEASAAFPAELASKLEVAAIRLQRARHVVHCIECAATAGSEIELGPVAFVAVELIDRLLEDLLPLAVEVEDAVIDWRTLHLRSPRPL